MPEKIGVGLISFAHPHQNAWAKVFSERADARVAAVWDDDEARGRAKAEALGVPFVAELGALLTQDDVHAVTICSENVKHADHAVQAAKAGKHVMVQKPMATTVADADRIVAAVRSSGVTYMQAYNLRFDSLHTKVKELVDEGAVGRVTVVRRRHSHHFGLTEEETNRVLSWMSNPDLSGGGALMDEGAHALLWYLWMFGRPRTVSAEITTLMPHLRVDDNVLLTFAFEGGMLGTLQTSWTEVAGGPTIEIYGEKGVIIATGTDIASTRFAPEDTLWLQVFRTETGAWEYPPIELEKARPVPPPNAFIDCLVAGKPSPVPVEDARNAVVMAVAAYDAAKAGRKVGLAFD